MVDVQISDTDIDTLIAEHNAGQKETSVHWNFDEQRRHVLKTWQDVQACPGSGKTTLVAAKLLILAKKWEDSHRGICVLTHTNVAKDEILEKVQIHPSGHNLTSYPHFIGTIQDFVGTFLGRPFCYSTGNSISYVDDEKCVEILEKTIGTTAKTYIDRQHTYNLYDLKIFMSDDGLKPYMPPGLVDPNSSTYKDLMKKKRLLVREGYFFYSEMYAFANKLILDNPQVIEALRLRFPIVLIDEMQDTQQFQDELINNIFAYESISLQRLGDPDQAIFNGMGEAHPNESYNNSTELHVVASTHRFGNDICDKIIGLSFHQIPQLFSDRTPNRGDKNHTIFIYSDETKANVLEAFCEKLEQEDPENTWRNIRALGGVKDERGIQGYWRNYNISNTSYNFKPSKFIDALNYCIEQEDGHSQVLYSLLIECVIELLKKQNMKTTNTKGKSVYYTKTSLQRELEQKDKHSDFRKILTEWIMNPLEAIENWTAQKEKICSLLEIEALTEQANNYLEITSDTEPEDIPIASTNNEYQSASGRMVKIGTIHSAKGETHDATLVLETKYSRWFDVAEVLDHLIDTNKARPQENLTSPTSKASILASFHKRLYVACSRPRYLLCLALHENHINEEQRVALQAKGWNIQILGDENE